MTNSSYAFHNCSNLTSIDISGWSTNNLSNCEAMFYHCENLETINFSGWDFSNISAWNYAFAGCGKLKNIIGPISGIKTDPGLNGSPLTKESALVILNGLADLTSGTKQTLYLHTSTFTLLSEDDLSIANEKNWNVQSL